MDIWHLHPFHIWQSSSQKTTFSKSMKQLKMKNEKFVQITIPPESLIPQTRSSLPAGWGQTILVPASISSLHCLSLQFSWLAPCTHTPLLWPAAGSGSEIISSLLGKYLLSIMVLWRRNWIKTLLIKLLPWRKFNTLLHSWLTLSMMPVCHIKSKI